MRSVARTARSDEDEESIFVSMTDMTVSFLFIIMILLAFFASQFNPQEMVTKADYEILLTERNAFRVEVDLLEAKIQEMETSISSLNTEISALKDRANIQASQMAVYRKRIDELEVQLEEQKRLIAELTRQIGEQAIKFKSVFAGQDATVANLQLQNQTLLSSNDGLESRLAVLNEAHVVLQRRLSELLTELEEYRDQVEEFKKQQANELALYLGSIAEARRNIVQSLRSYISSQFPDLIVEVSPNEDALRFKGDDLFRSDQYEIPPDTRTYRIVSAIAEGLNALLPCFTTGPYSALKFDCNPGLAIIEAVQIEGHTDTTGAEDYNLNLSLDRGAETFRVIEAVIPGISEYRNFESQPVLSVSGYGELRPISTGSVIDHSVNRRIDLRFIMSTPTTIDEVVRLKQRIQEKTNEVVR